MQLNHKLINFIIIGTNSHYFKEKKNMEKLNSEFIKKYKKIIIGAIILLLGIIFYTYHQHNQVSQVIKNHTYKVMVTGPDKSGDTVKQCGVLIFADNTYKEGSDLDEDFSDLSDLIDSARENDSSSYTAAKNSITLSSGYSDDTPSHGDIAHLKNLKSSKGGKIITGDITYKYEDDSAVDENAYEYNNITTKTAHATIQLEQIK